jgi:hypothetical protein
VDETQVVVAILSPAPWRPRVTHWSSRLLARQLGVSVASIIEVWHKWDLQPWRRESFKFSDPELEAKLTDGVAFTSIPWDNAVVVGVDEKGQVQALDRTQPMPPLRPGCPSPSPTTTYIRGVTTLFAALEVATGQVIGACDPATATGVPALPTVGTSPCQPFVWIKTADELLAKVNLRYSHRGQEFSDHAAELRKHPQVALGSPHLLGAGHSKRFRSSAAVHRQDRDESRSNGKAFRAEHC